MYHEITHGTEVQILETGHSHEGAYGHVRGLPGDEDSLGDPIPSGWVEVQLGSTCFNELFREDDLIHARLTL